MDNVIMTMMLSMLLAAISGVTIGLGGDDEKKCGVAAGVAAFIVGYLTPIYNFVLAVGAILLFISLGLTLLFQSGDTVKSTGRVGVGVPGESYPMDGFRKPTIKNMVKM